jgi:hypothetical protein
MVCPQICDKLLITIDIEIIPIPSTFHYIHMSQYPHIPKDHISTKLHLGEYIWSIFNVPKLYM